MNSWVSFVPPLAVALFSGGFLILIVRRDGLHALSGLVLMGWAGALIASEISVRRALAEGVFFSALLIVVTLIHATAGCWLLLGLRQQTGNTELK